MLVELPQPFDFGLTLERFRTFAPDPANLWLDGVFYRVLDGKEVRMEPAPGGVRIEPEEPALAEPVERFLGAGFDLQAFEAFAEGEPVLARLAGSLRGLRPVLVPDAFEMLVGAITSQQISLRAALAIRSRFISMFGEAAGRAYAFPRSERVAMGRPEDLTAIGFSRRKAETVLALTQVDFAGLDVLPDEEVIGRLTELPGIGRWTADWFLARHLGRPHAWPAGDLGLRKAVSAFYLGARDVSVEETRTFGERFASQRNLAAHYLLVGLRCMPGKSGTAG